MIVFILDSPILVGFCCHPHNLFLVDSFICIFAGEFQRQIWLHEWKWWNIFMFGVELYLDIAWSTIVGLTDRFLPNWLVDIKEWLTDYLIDYIVKLSLRTFVLTCLPDGTHDQIFAINLNKMSSFISLHFFQLHLWDID